jgi:thiamine biosynthesis lipoprotein
MPWLRIACLALLQGCGNPPVEVAELSGRTMGTTYSIKLAQAPGAASRGALQQRVEQRLAEIDRQMSTYRTDSDLMRFNRTQSTDWQSVPARLVELIDQANRISGLTDGSYDVTVGPLVNLWGFGSSASRTTPPPADEIASALRRTGYRHLAVRRSPPAMRKAVAALEVDLSSIAKGWAVDQLAALLKDAGLGNFLVEIGGELRAVGEKSPGTPWRVAIERPATDRRAVHRVIALRDMAVASSGDYRNFFEDDGQRYSHTIDPATGRPVRHRLAAVTVFADRCAEADAWATALLALGERRGPQLAAELGLRAMFIVRDDLGLREQISPALGRAALLD